jgi:hypothetical protein
MRATKPSWPPCSTTQPNRTTHGTGSRRSAAVNGGFAWLTQREEFPGVVAVHMRLVQASGVIVELREVLQFEGDLVRLGPLAAGTFMTVGPS